MAGPAFGSLFAGIGGLDLGLERAGWRCAWQIEKERNCKDVLAKHWPGVTRYGDIGSVDFSGVPHVELICGGFPCQPFSLSGQRKGDADERWLWPWFFKAVSEVGPEIVLLENVPGLLSMVREFGEILRDLASLGMHVWWDCLPASAFGAYHERDRLFLLAFHARQRRDAWCDLAQGGKWRAQLEHRRLSGLAVATRTAAPHKRFECEPGVGRMVDGVPGRAHRLTALGNAVYPPLPEWLGGMLLQVL